MGLAYWTWLAEFSGRNTWELRAAGSTMHCICLSFFHFFLTPTPPPPPTKKKIPTFRISCVMYTPKAKKIFAMLCTNSLYFLVFVIYAFHVKHILMRKCCYMWLPRGSTTCWDLRVQITIILKLWIEIDNLIHAQSNIQKLK